MDQQKYKINEFRGSNVQEKSLNALVAVANELHNIYSVLWKIKEKQ